MARHAVCLLLLTALVSTCSSARQSIPVGGAFVLEAESTAFTLEGSSRQLLQSTFLCYRGLVQCPSGIEECYNPTFGCDGNTDCSDGSDEAAAFCAGFNCTALGLGKCPSNKCTPNPIGSPRTPSRFFICDGTPDCRDKSDEDPGYCASYNCESQGSGSCPGGNQCIPKISSTDRNNANGPYFFLTAQRFGPTPTGRSTALCDGVQDCKDNSDEEPGFCASYTCNTGAFKCANNRQCVSRSKVCDGKYDCPDNSDEDPTLCGPSYDCSQAGTLYGSGIAYTHCPSGVGCYRGSGADCNGVYDCLDQSDENPVTCRDITCPSGTQKCPSGVGCVYSFQLCNGAFDCLDKSDESSATCAAIPCTPPNMPCPSGGGCVAIDHICDGTPNCADGSDESDGLCQNYNCADGSGREACPSGVGCVTSYNLCNGIPGDGFSFCKDKSDEDAAFCAKRSCLPNQLRCRDGTCIFGSLCNGLEECVDKSDEDPSYCAATACHADEAKCADGRQCISSNSQCDGFTDCRDKSDETAATCLNFTCPRPSDTFKCRSTGQCLLNDIRCDGVEDCADGTDEDESFCQSFSCGLGKIKCPGTNICAYGTLCDGRKDCPDGMDESASVCGSGSGSGSGSSSGSGSGSGAAASPPASAPASADNGVCGTGDFGAFPTRCYFNSDQQGRYVCCDFAGCDGFNPPDYSFPHCKNNGIVPPGYGVGSANPPANPPTNSPPETPSDPQATTGAPVATAAQAAPGPTSPPFAAAPGARVPPATQCPAVDGFYTNSCYNTNGSMHVCCINPDSCGPFDGDGNPTCTNGRYYVFP